MPIGEAALIQENQFLDIVFSLAPLLILGSQAIVSHSLAKAEYIAMAVVTYELTWLRYLLLDLQINNLGPIIFHCDNKAALHIAMNLVFHE